MDGNSPSRGESYLPSSSEDDMLPTPHLTATSLLGNSTQERETIGKLYAAQIASMLATKSPDETRTIIFGFGLEQAEVSREQFFDLLNLVAKCL